MTGTEAKQLWEYQVQLRRTAAGREEGAEEQIRREYQKILKKLQAIIARYYARYGNAEDSTMTQGDLRAAGQYKNFLQDIADNLDGIAEPVDKQIRQTIEDTYTACYDGMVNAVKQSTAGNVSLQSVLSGLSAATPETVKHIVEHPMKKLKLSTVLNRRRSQIVTSTKKTLVVGLASGDSYARMAQRIAETLNGDYKKAMRIVRTEANRAINRGFQDVTEEAAELLSDSEYVEVKEWCSMEDESVRDTHRHLNGKKIHALDVFHSGGASADCPGAFGVAGEDINCRCFLAYSFMLRSEFLAQGGTIPGTAKENAETEQAEKTSEQQIQLAMESTPQPSPVNASSVGHAVEVDVKTPKDNGGTGKTYKEEKIPGKALTSVDDGGIMKMGKVKEYKQSPADFSKYTVYDDPDEVESVKNNIISAFGIEEKDVDLSGIRNAGVLKPFMDQMIKIHNQTGFSFPNITSVEVIDGDSCCIAGYKPLENRFYISSRYFNSKDASLDTLKDWVANGILPKQGKSIRYLAEHESAHMRIPDIILQSDEAVEIHKSFLRSKSYNANGQEKAEFFADSLAIYRINPNTNDNNIIKAVKYLKKEGIL